MLVNAILTDSARLCAAWVEFAFRTVQRPAQPNLRRAQETQQPTTRSDAHKTHKFGVLNQVGRKRGFRKVVGFPVAGPLFGASTPVRRNGTGLPRGKARGGHTSPIPAEIAWMRWVYLGRGPLVRPHRRKSFIVSPFSKLGFLWRGYSGLKTPLRSTQKFLRRDVDGGGGGATRPSAALAPSAPAAHRLLMRCSRAARSESRASARSQRCCGLRPQRPLAARPSAALAPSAPAGTCIGMRLSRAGQSHLARLLARKPWTPRAFRAKTM